MPFNFLKQSPKLIELGDIQDKISLPNVELISIHIPKTAGTSFYNTLLDQYSDAAVRRVDISTHRGFQVDKEKRFELKKLQSAKVIHGHFSLSELKEYFDFSENIPVITWLRNPTNRVISNYFYLKSMLEKQVDKTTFPGLFPRLCRSLLEFASIPGSGNKQAKYLEDRSPEDFAFIGKTEQFSEDIQRLADLLNWDKKKLKVYHHNPTKSTKHEITEEEKDLIAEMNKKDWEWYNKV
jgi:hypothetical protein